MVKKLQGLITIISLALFITGCQYVIPEFDNDNHNDLGMAYMEQGEYEKAIDEFEKALENGMDKSAIYNNLSWAYNELEEFELGLEYIIEANKLDSDDPIQYTNLGNSLSGLLRYEEAIESYEKAIELDAQSEYAYYGLGVSYMNIYDYGKSEEYLLKYLEFKPDDYDAKVDLTYCLLYQENFLKAYSYIENVINDNPNDFDAYDLKGYIMEYMDSEKNVEAFYQDMSERFPEEVEAALNIGIYYYSLESYNKAITYFEEAYEKFPNDGDVNAWLAACYSVIGKNDEAMAYAETAINIEPSPSNYNTMGNILFDQTRYLEAITYYEQANESFGTLDESSCVNIIYAYYLANRYQKAIDFGLSVVDELFYSYDIPWIMAYAYTERNEYENAIEYLNLAEKRGADDYSLFYDLAENCYYLGDYDQSEDYINKCLDVNPDDYSALYLQEIMELKKSGSENLVHTIFNDYYLYSNINENSKLDISKFRDLSYEETEELFYSLVKEDDLYSFYLCGEVYDYLINDESSSIDFRKINDETYLIDIKFFNEDTDHLFIEYIDTIVNPEEKNLIINVMDNSGGMTDSAINILDSLLPAVTVCSTIDRTGYVYPYYTSNCQIDFRNIYVFINEDSASASELLTLGLDTFLNNVTIIGQRSTGKGVGQLYFEEPNKKAAYYIVNHYWNVREINIMNVGIVPDIVIDEPSIEKNIEIIKELL